MRTRPDRHRGASRPRSCSPSVFRAPREGDAPTPIYLDTSYSFAERAADLVARLTPQQRASPARVEPGAGDHDRGESAADRTRSAGRRRSPRRRARATRTSSVASTAGDDAAGAKLTIDPDGTPETVTVTTRRHRARRRSSADAGRRGEPGRHEHQGDRHVRHDRRDTRSASTPAANVEFAHDPDRRHLGRRRHRRHADRPARARARGRRGGAGPRHRRHVHARARRARHAYGGAGERARRASRAYGWWNEALHGVIARVAEPVGQRGRR